MDFVRIAVLFRRYRKYMKIDYIIFEMIKTRERQPLSIVEHARTHGNKSSILGFQYDVCETR
uniref:Uncharacterized protein n=1 Tax=Lepeophtheirus salmonis TaxID=72036 RepID=A0A0K2TJ14_LEPSM